MTGVGRELHVHGEAFPLAGADFVRETGPREEVVAVLVQGNREDAGGLVENRLDSIPVVRVDVDVQDPPDPVLIEQGPDPDCDVVEDAEAGRTVRHRMVEPAAEVEGPCAASRRHLRTSPQGCTHLEGRCLVHPCEDGIVHRPETMGLREPWGSAPSSFTLATYSGR